MQSDVSTAGADQDLGRRIEELEQELSEAYQREAATADVLRVIGSSPSDTRAVLNMVAESAARLCDAYDATIHQVDAGLLRLVAHHGPILTGPTIPMVRGALLGRAILERRGIQVADLPAEGAEYPEGSDAARRLGFRTVLAIPLIRAGDAVGAIAIRRTEVRPFTDRQVQLLKTFADQAVIAIENTRLFEAEQASKRELQESLEYQTATSDVLSVISRSKFDLQPVLDTITSTASRLCAAHDAAIVLREGTDLRVAARRVRRDFNKIPIGRDSVAGRTVLDRVPVHVHDLASAVDEFRLGRERAVRFGHRTTLGIPLLKQEEAIGCLVLWRMEVHPFTDKQIDLVTTFADQAVIAIENTRLFEAEQARTAELQARSAELSQSLEYQTAISNVLSVISRSASELQPVLAEIARTAANLCEASDSIISLERAGELHLVASHGLIARGEKGPINRGWTAGRAFIDCKPVHVHDLMAAREEFPLGYEIGRQRGHRTTLAIPLLREGKSIGCLFLRRTVVRPFSEKQIALLQTFADQAVIAIENTRLFEKVQTRTRELTESLEHQTATSDVLQVISSSPGQLQPVYETILTKALRHCDAKFGGLFRYEDGVFQGVAGIGIPEGLLIGAEEGAGTPTANSDLKSLVANRQPMHSPDLRQNASYLGGDPFIVGAVERGGARAALLVPLVKEDSLIGALAIYRQEVRPFSDKQVQLVQSFADQAVIAIENTRLLNELRESLEYQIATSEILNVISRSPNDAQPVFHTIARTAARLCKAEFCHVCRFDGALIYSAAANGLSPEGSKALRRGYPMAPGRGTATARSILSCSVEEIPDVHADLDYTQSTDATIMNLRSVVAVPMLKDGRPIGTIAVARSPTGRFPSRQIELLKTFADQAVIAIENTRLFEAEQASKHELQESLEYQTAISDVLGVISRSPSQLQPVVDTIVQTAKRLCSAERANIWRLRDGKFDLLAHTFTEPALAQYLRDNPIPADRGSLSGRAVLERRAIHLPDASADLELRVRKQIDRIGSRTMLVVPLLREQEAIGALSLTKTRVEPFADKQIDLVTTFADQAVIAIENTRLFEELQQKNHALTEAHAQVSGALQRETATSEILRVIGSSPTDVHPVFETIARSGVSVCGALGCVVLVVDGGMIRMAATHGVRPERLERFRHEYPLPLSAEIDTAQTIRSRRMFHLADIENNPNATSTDIENARLAGYRTRLMVPMVRGDRTLGLIAVTREDPAPFPDQLVELLRTFADQAVIAIENARLFEEVQTRTRELQESLEYQTATSDVLNVISRAPSQLQPVFDAIVSTARRLCQADNAFVYTLDGATYRLATSDRAEEEYVKFLLENPIAPGRGTLVGRVSLEQRTVHLPDATATPEYDWVESPKRGNFRTMLGVPLMRGGVVIGVIAMVRRAVNPFSDKQVDLVTTFADQALIAIENVRLFEEVQARTRELARSVEELKSLGEVSQTVNSSLALEKVLPAILEHACAMSYASGGAIYEFHKASGEFHLAAGRNMTNEHIARVRAQPSRLGDPVVGECGDRREAVQIADLRAAPSSPLLDILLRMGVRAILAVPLMHQGDVIGALVVRRNHPGAFSAEIIHLLEAFAAQSAIAVHNARLFEEIAQKSHELEIASQHKSQFVANMSHELRTPLAAILGYAELMQEGFYEPLGQKSMDALTRIRSNGKHLLGLINTVLDIAKIESGQFSLNLAEYALDSVVETVRVATESLAETKKLSLKTDVAKRLPVGWGDEQRLAQVLLNLVGNAIKFTDTGEVRITATAMNGHFTVAVTDTGPGIPPEELKRVFEQFHQIDNSNTKAKGGTGLGLAIAKQIVEMHGGRIWVESTLGKGATFQMELPIRAEFSKGTS